MAELGPLSHVIFSPSAENNWKDFQCMSHGSEKRVMGSRGWIALEMICFFVVARGRWNRPSLRAQEMMAAAWRLLCWTGIDKYIL